MTAGKNSKRGQSIAFHVQLNREICSVNVNDGVHAVIALLDMVQAKHNKMNLVNLSTALHRLARVAMEDERLPSFLADKRMVLLHARVKQEIDASHCAGNLKDARTNARCLSTIAWACGRLQVNDEEMMNTIGDLAKGTLSFFKEFELSNLLWGFAKMQVAHSALFEAASHHVFEHMQEFTPANLSMVAWAFATAKFRPCRRLLFALAGSFAEAMATPEGIRQNASPVVLENMIWALATTGVRCKPETLEVIGNACTSMLENFKAHELAITLWAFARLDTWHEQLYLAATVLLCQNAALRADLHTQAVTNILWAYAKQCPHPTGEWQQLLGALLTQLLPVVQTRLVQMKPMEVNATLGSVLTLSQALGAENQTFGLGLAPGLKAPSHRPERVAAYQSEFNFQPCYVGHTGKTGKAPSSPSSSTRASDEEEDGESSAACSLTSLRGLHRLSDGCTLYV
mmetsp:Transcript_69660/g.167192  ORF Transcript_69660/g.167192 Transcript_69660/m.167192 type:complete len:457 (+) Transcript_69660:204-1574(+)|eukprot:CAMPEP_0178439508 /NCGR_PEP_ID=MMETSP0689_2-20121128/36195_1 /TAXON_ID=160604 /ORGANISM="Amphidinium massartii, Strain CS-259" /LENGTH=456 /DNA_ID=CAMNT_0020062045 /DNA_START=108 /DNA_END=1478 /DNA_ORIENTATION=+